MMDILSDGLPEACEPPEGWIRIPGLGGSDVGLVESLLNSGGFIISIVRALGDGHDMIYIRSEDREEVREFLSEFRVRSMGDSLVPIPW